jgi:hypothetical protein
MIPILTWSFWASERPTAHGQTLPRLLASHRLICQGRYAELDIASCSAMDRPGEQGGPREHPNVPA